MILDSEIQVKDAYENNLKHLDVTFPLGKFTCVTGCSGGGKSSLVFDTVYAESQRAFLESMSGNLYGQKFMNKPKVEYIRNLRPALNISQTYYNVNPRSTVGSVSEISFYLRGLFAIVSTTKNKMYTEKTFSSYAIGSCCPKCLGTGDEYCISEDLVIPDKDKTLRNGGILYFKGSETSFEYRSLVALCEHFEIDIDKSINELTKQELNNLLYTEERMKFRLRFKSNGVMKTQVVHLRGAISKLTEKLEDSLKNGNLTGVAKYTVKRDCSLCNGLKLCEESLSIKVCRLNISEVENLSLKKFLEWIENVEKKYEDTKLYELLIPIINQIKLKISFLFDLKIDYLSLSRRIPTLSGGERQRLRFANQLGCSLKDLIYILDEPCKGLHYRDIKNIISATRNLVRNGNTVIAIEHNKQFIAEAEKIIELGPVGGPNGGYIIESNVDYKLSFTFKEKRNFEKFIELKDINFRTLKNQNVQIPINGITCISGVSGSGKSTLVSVILKCFENRRNVNCASFIEGSMIKKVMEVNQNPIGKTPRSTILSYLDLADELRTVFAMTTEAQISKIPSSYFSMNVEGGRCECCLGTGLQKIEMNYLPSTFISCPECNGNRFQEQILNIKYNGKNIKQVLDEPISDVISLFENNKKIYNVLECLIKLGLGYLKLGQMSMNLSGGESQRIKLAKALGVYNGGNWLFVLDEPTIGLNEKDIYKFKEVLLDLQNKGNTILIIEHNIEFIASVADFLIDFGLNGGDAGGQIVSRGSVEEVIEDKASSWYGL